MGQFPLGRRAIVRYTSFLLAAFLVVGGFAVQKHQQATTYQALLTLNYRHAFAELSANLDALNTDLQKGVYATSPAMISALCTQMFGRAMAAQMALGELPYGNIELEQTAAFLAKAGDYAAYLVRNAVQNGGCTQEDRQTLNTLAQSARMLSSKVSSLQSDLQAGATTLESISEATLRLSAATEDGTAEAAGSSYQTIESDFPELPSLIYDGPFSEHIAGRTPIQLEGLAQVSPDEARTVAGSFFRLKPSIFTLISSGGGTLPTYGFSVKIDGGESYIEVTRTGGKVMEVISGRAVGEASLTQEEGLIIATDFLIAQGYPSMRQTYYIDQGNVLTVNFAYAQGDVLCYTDLIKVSVALDNGRIVGFDAKGYLMNHCDRKLPTPAIASDSARKSISADLTILSYQLTLIPTGGEHEVLTHEFKCQDQEGRHILIYINTETGQEEKILILLEDESGTLVL